MEKTKQDRANFRVQHIPIEEMFTAQELMDLKTAFEAVSMGEAFVNTESLKALFADMQIYPCLLYTSPSPRDRTRSRMPSSA